MPKKKQKKYNAFIQIFSLENIHLLAKDHATTSPIPPLNQFRRMRFHNENYFIKNTDNPHLPEKIEKALTEKNTKETA